jgi:uroporphyrinogen III methyltransferase/synthase
MGLRRLGEITRQLQAHGKPADTPAATVQEATLGSQRTVTGTLGTLAEQVAAAGLASPALTIIGPTVALRQGASWFEARPLFGKGVLLTRPREQADEAARRLEALGAAVYRMPTVTIEPAPDPARVTEACQRLHEYQWLVFTSVNGVEGFMQGLAAAGRDVRALGGLKLAAIGPKTADALIHRGLQPDVTPVETRSEGLAALLLDHVRGQRVLLAAADRGRETLREQLAAVAAVEHLPVYRQTDVKSADPAVIQALQAGRIHFAFFTSGNIVRAFWQLLDEPTRDAVRRRVRVVSISPLTSEAIRALGLAPAVEAKEYTVEGMIAALLAALGEPGA